MRPRAQAAKLKQQMVGIAARYGGPSGAARMAAMLNEYTSALADQIRDELVNENTAPPVSAEDRAKRAANLIDPRLKRRTA